MTAPGESAPEREGAHAERARWEAFVRLSEAFRPSLERYFRRRTGNPAEIDDLVQDVFLRLLVRGGVENLVHLGGYVFETASSVLKDRLRQRAVRRTGAHIPFNVDEHANWGGDDADFSAERVLLAKEALRRAAMALLDLPERTRTVFILRRLEGLKYDAVARRLGISVSAVEKHMKRAMRRLIESTGDDR